MTIDLTTLDRPLGEYDAETKGRLMDAWHKGGLIECHYLTDVFREIAWPTWGADVVYRLRPEPLRDMVAPEVWRMLNPKWRWMARDENDDVWAYDFKPELKQARWDCSNGDCLYLTSLFAPGLIDPGTKPWNESLIERPEGV